MYGHKAEQATQTHTQELKQLQLRKKEKIMSDKCGSCDCADKTQCVKKGTSYTFDIVETQESYKDAMFMDVGAEENGCQCKCGSTCSCVNCTCCPN